MDDVKKRFEEQLARWFKDNAKKGYSEDNLKLYLIEHGYHSQDINECLHSANRYYNKEYGKAKNKLSNPFQNFSAKEFIRPTFVKMFLPAVLLLLILLSFVVNSLVFPKIGDIACKDVQLKDAQNTNHNSLIAAAITQNADANQVLQLINKSYGYNNDQDALQSQSAGKLRTVALTDFYLYNTGIYKINPLFPTPCNPDSTSKGVLCYDYFHAETANCVNDATTSTYLDEGTSASQKTVFIVFLISALILIAILYLLSCLFVHMLDYLGGFEQKNQLMILGGIFLLMIISILIGSGLLITLFAIMLVFGFMLFVKIDAYKELILAMFAFMMLVFMFVLFFIANSQANIISANHADVTLTSYYCNSTGILSSDEILFMLHTEAPLDKSLEEYYAQGITGDPYYPYSSEEFNVCINPDCKTICVDACKRYSKVSADPYSLRGTTPSCVCSCESRT